MPVDTARLPAVGDPRTGDWLVTPQITAAGAPRAGDWLVTPQITAAGAPRAGDWLVTPQIIAVGLRLDDETIRVAMGHRLGAKTCESHVRVDSKNVS